MLFPVPSPKSGPKRLAHEHSELLPKSEVFEQKVPTSAEGPEHCAN
jgi:hypothetical protein